MIARARAAALGLRPILALGISLALASLPRTAAACAVCGAGRDDETRFAFILTTVGLSVLPLAMLGGMIWWMVRRARQLQMRTGSEAELLSRSSSLP